MLFAKDALLVKRIRALFHTASFRWFFVLGMSAVVWTAFLYLQYEWEITLPRPNMWMAKYIIFFGWLWGLKQASHYVFLRESWPLNRQIKRQLWIAGVVFILTVVPYGPYDVELTFFFFSNMLLFACIAYVLFYRMAAPPEIRLCGQGVLKALNGSLWGWAGLAFFVNVIVSYYLAGRYFHHIPAIDDSIAQYVHAKIVASGKLYADASSLTQLFPIKMMVQDGAKWYSQYPPGHVFLLALGWLMGGVEWVSPLLGAMTALAIIWLTKELYGNYTAKIASILAIACVYIKVVSAGYMNNVSALLMATLFFVFYFRVLRLGCWKSGFLGGVALGYCFIIRPYSAFYLALPMAIYAAYLLKGRWREYCRPFMAMALASLVFIGFQLWYNQLTTGDALVFGYEKRFGAWHNPFTEKAIERLDFAMFIKNLRLDLQRLSQFNKMLFQWPLPVLGLLVPLFVYRGRKEENLLLAAIASIFLGLLLLPGNIDRGWGPRLAYETTGLWVVLCARALTLWPVLIRRVCIPYFRLSQFYGCVFISLSFFYVAAMPVYLNPEYLRTEHLLRLREYNYDFYTSLRDGVEKPALIFVPRKAYKYVAFNGPYDHNSPIIFAADSGPDENNIGIIKLGGGRYIYYVREYEKTPIPCSGHQPCSAINR